MAKQIKSSVALSSGRTAGFAISSEEVAQERRIRSELNAARKGKNIRRVAALLAILAELNATRRKRAAEHPAVIAPTKRKKKKNRTGKRTIALTDAMPKYQDGCQIVQGGLPELGKRR